jgi:hypothetical protein
MFGRNENSMSKKKVRRQKHEVAARGSARKKYVGITATGLLVILCLGMVMGMWGDWRGARRMRALFSAVPPPSIPTANNPSKEYIYAGGKLIATEEPQPLAAPVNLIADTLSGSQINITWTASPGADHYQIERTQNITQAYSVISSNVAATSFTDTDVTSVSAYLYRVRAVGSSGNPSSYSNVDLATAITFADDPLTIGSTLIKAQHVSQLRQAVNAVRAVANLGAVSWTDNTLSGITIKAIHIQEIRTKLDEALSALGLSAGQYTDSSLSGTAIKKVHIDEIRQRVK